MALNWCSHQGSNLKSSDYESGALTLLSYANNLVQDSARVGLQRVVQHVSTQEP